MAEAQGFARREGVAAGLPRLERARESPLGAERVELGLSGVQKAPRRRPRRPGGHPVAPGASLAGT